MEWVFLAALSHKVKLFSVTIHMSACFCRPMHNSVPPQPAGQPNYRLYVLNASYLSSYV